MYCEAVKAFKPVLATTNPVGWHVNAHNSLENMARTGPGVAAMRGEIAASHRRVGHAWRNAKKYTDALLRYREAEKVAAEWVKEADDSVEARNELARCHYDQAVIHDQLGETEDAVRHLEAARDLRRPLVKRAPERRELHYDLGLTLSLLAALYADLGRHGDAEAALQDGADEYRLAGAPADAQSRAALAANLLRQAQLAQERPSRRRRDGASETVCRDTKSAAGAVHHGARIRRVGAVRHGRETTTFAGRASGAAALFWSGGRDLETGLRGRIQRCEQRSQRRSLRFAPTPPRVQRTLAQTVKARPVGRSPCRFLESR